MTGQKEYEDREITSHLRRLDEINKSPLSERRDGERELSDALGNWKASEGKDSYLVERVFGWAYNGTFGAGIYFRFQHLKPIIKERTLIIMLFREACMLNFLVGEREYTRAFKAAFPSREDQSRFNAALIAEMKEIEDKE